MISLRLTTRRATVAAISLTCTAAGSAVAQATYQQPPAPIAQMLDAAPVPAVQPSPDGRWLLVLERPALPPIAVVAAPMLRLAGDRINPRTTDDPRQPTLTGLRLESVGGGPGRQIQVPAGSRIHHILWSDDSRRVAMTIERGDTALTIWVANVATGAAHELIAQPLAAAAGAPCAWLPADQGLICRFRPANRGPAPEPAATPGGPTIEESSGHAIPNPTYEDLLANSDDEALFDYYYQSQLARVSLGGTVSPLGAPAIIVASDPSPDGRYILVEALHRPYSYHVPRARFPARIEVWDAATAKVMANIADLPLQESVPISLMRCRPGLAASSGGRTKPRRSPGLKPLTAAIRVRRRLPMCATGCSEWQRHSRLVRSSWRPSATVRPA